VKEGMMEGWVLKEEREMKDGRKLKEGKGREGRKEGKGHEG
jgi:hypothetical protein